MFSSVTSLRAGFVFFVFVVIVKECHDDRVAEWLTTCDRILISCDRPSQDTSVFSVDFESVPPPQTHIDKDFYDCSSLPYAKVARQVSARVVLQALMVTFCTPPDWQLLRSSGGCRRTRWEVVVVGGWKGVGWVEVGVGGVVGGWVSGVGWGGVGVGVGVG